MDAEKKPKPVTILVNKKSVVVPDKDTTGEQIKEAAGVPLDFSLYKKHGDKLDEIKNDEALTVHEGETFVAVSGQDVS